MKHPRGFSIIEIVVSAGIFLGAVVAFIVAFTVATDVIAHTADRTQAGLLLEEGAEALIVLRDMGWDETIATYESDTPYSLYFADGAYHATTTSVTIAGGYFRTVTFSPAYRDGSDVIASAGTLDENTRHVTIVITRAEDGEVLVTGGALVHNVHDVE